MIPDGRQQFLAIPEMDWARSGHCYGRTDLAPLFFGESIAHNHMTVEAAEAASYCLGNAATDFVRCPVFAECLEHALDVPERHGVWAATIPIQRIRLRRRRDRISRIA